MILKANNRNSKKGGFVGYLSRQANVDLLVFLQNPWTKKRVFLGKPWDDEQWEKALWESRSGIRLAQVLPKRLTVAVRNANPIPTRHVTGIRYPDPVYVREQIGMFSPRLLLLCGVEARKIVMMGFNIPFITMPHPAFRLLSGHALDAIKAQIQSRFKDLYPELAEKPWIGE